MGGVAHRERCNTAVSVLAVAPVGAILHLISHCCSLLSVRLYAEGPGAMLDGGEECLFN